MDEQDDTWLLVLNPVSGRGAGLRDRHRIEAALGAQRISFRTAVSERAGHTVALVAQAVAAGCRRVVVAGGDGSLNEAANGILRQDRALAESVRLALIPLGTGNDWARSRAVAPDYGVCAAILASGCTSRQDVGVIDFADGTRRFFVNVAGAGFDAGVIERMPSRRLGRLAYVVGLLRGLAAYRPVPLLWRSEGRQDGAEAFVMFACIGRHCGGGMLVAPDASDTDARLNLVLIRHMGRLEVLRSLPRLFDGSIYRHGRVTHWTAARIELLGPPGTSVEADGELVGRLPATVSVWPLALQVAVPPS